MAAADEQHYFLVSDLIAAAEVVPFLGAGASFLQKPFTFELLRQKLDTLAEQPARNGKGPT